MTSTVFVKGAGDDVISLYCNLEVATVFVVVTGCALNDAAIDKTDVTWCKKLDDPSFPRLFVSLVEVSMVEEEVTGFVLVNDAVSGECDIVASTSDCDIIFITSVLEVETVEVVLIVEFALEDDDNPSGCEHVA